MPRGLSHNPSWMARVEQAVCRRERRRGEHGKQWICFYTLMQMSFFTTQIVMELSGVWWHYLGRDLLTCGSGDKSLRGQSTRPPSDEDYTIKLLVSPVVRNRPKCHERCLEGRIPWYCLNHLVYFWFTPQNHTNFQTYNPVTFRDKWKGGHNTGI